MQNYTRNLKSGFAAIVFCAATLAAGSASAYTSDGPRITIQTNALMTARGVARTYEKITHRASNVCGVTGVQPIQSKLAAKACSVKLVDEWVVNIDNAALTAFHLTRTHSGV